MGYMHEKMSTSELMVRTELKFTLTHTSWFLFSEKKNEKSNTKPSTESLVISKINYEEKTVDYLLNSNVSHYYVAIIENVLISKTNNAVALSFHGYC